MCKCSWQNLTFFRCYTVSRDTGNSIQDPKYGPSSSEVCLGQRKFWDLHDDSQKKKKNTARKILFFTTESLAKFVIKTNYFYVYWKHFKNVFKIESHALRSLGTTNKDPNLSDQALKLGFYLRNPNKEYMGILFHKSKFLFEFKSLVLKLGFW